MADLFLGAQTENVRARVPQDIYAALKEVAAKREMPMSVVVSDILRKALSRRNDKFYVKK
jgi:hypothetical protein